MRFQYLVDPSDDSSLRLEAHYANSEGGQRGIKSHGLFADTGFGGPACVNIDLDDLKSSCVDGFGAAVIEDNDVVTSDLANDRDDIEAFGISTTYKLDRGDYTITSITAIEQNEYDHWEDADGLPVPFVLFRQKSDTDQGFPRKFA